jgi:hypothetical protein
MVAAAADRQGGLMTTTKTTVRGPMIGWARPLVLACMLVLRSDGAHAGVAGGPATHSAAVQR